MAPVEVRCAPRPIRLATDIHAIADDQGLQTALTTLAARYDLHYLLAWLDDGVVWGLFKDGHWQLSNTVAPKVSPPLRLMAVQEVRAFGPSAEVRYTPAAEGLRATILHEVGEKERDSYDEAYLLWGSVGGRVGDFTRMTEGRQGLVHLVPGHFAVPPRVALKVRHYLAYKDECIAYVCYSRLVGLAEMEVENGATE